MLDEIWAARWRLQGVARRTPLFLLEGAKGSTPIWLKLENLQVSGSFKLRGLYNRIAKSRDEVIAKGARTVSAGNAAIGAAIACRELGAPLEVMMGDKASPSKMAVVRSLGATVVQRPYGELIDYMVNERWRDEDRVFVHPFDHPDVWAGNGTCGLEILEDLPEVRTILVPIGGGGLMAGIGSLVRGLAPRVRLVGVQAAASAPWPEALRRGGPYRVPDPQPTIADGINVPTVFPNMWNALSGLLDDCLAVTEEEIEAAMRLLAFGNRVVAEGAGAAATAAALKLEAGDGPVVAIVSGGNVDAPVLTSALT